MCIRDRLNAMPEITSVISYVGTVGAPFPTEYVPESQLSELISDHYSRIVLTVGTDTDGEQAFSVVNKVREIAQGAYPDTYHLTGQAVNTLDLKDTVVADNVRVNAVAIGAIFVILLLTFRSISLPILLPVSYTHLDVYKRQPFCFVQEKFGLLSFLSASRFPLCLCIDAGCSVCSYHQDQYEK